jgi:glutaredoxin
VFRRRRAARVTRQVVLYGKPGCHLCEDARALLDSLGARYPLDLREIDITSDPALFRQYDIRIPVITIDNAIELDAPIDAKKLERALAR